MRESTSTLLKHYQVRKTIEQKTTFINWLNEHAKTYDYEITTQTFKDGKGRNLIVGDIKEAEVIITAHYDTPPNAFLPVITVVGSIPMYILSQLFAFIPIGIAMWIFARIFANVPILGFLVPFFATHIPLISLFILGGWSIQMMMGFANKNNANDNTSGVSVLLSTLEEIPTDLRKKACFVFFDEEEKGLEGAKEFKKSNIGVIKDKPLINFDCVAHGKHILFIAKKEFRNSRFNETLTTAIGEAAFVKKAINYVYPSDQLIFKNSVGVTVVNKIPLIGFYLGRLHSALDTKFNADHIETLSEITIKFIKSSVKTTEN